MEGRWFDAAREGSVAAIRSILDEYPLALERLCLLGPYAETPLHIAAMLGHLAFAKEILKQKPTLTSVLDSNKATPLHLAAATTNLEMVRLLCNANSSMCLAPDRYGKTPLHVAAFRGHIAVLKWLLQVKREAALMIANERNYSILHLCVKYNQVEALKVLVQEMSGDGFFINSTDYEGNTILHLAVLDKQFEAVNFLIQSSNINLNAVNLHGQTALDMLYMKDGDMIGRALLHAGALSSNCLTFLSSQGEQGQRQECVEDKKDEEDVERFLNLIREPGIIAASVITAAAFQSGINPPGGVWQDSTNNHTAGLSVLADKNLKKYKTFLINNTMALVFSVSVFMMLLANLPYKRHPLLLSVLMIITISAVSFFCFSYAASISATTATTNPVAGQLYNALVVVSSLWTVIFLRPVISRIYSWYLGNI